MYGNRILIFLGKISYELYLVHGIVIWIITKIMASNLNMGIHFVVLGISIGIARLFYFIDGKLYTLINKISGDWTWCDL